MSLGTERPFKEHAVISSMLSDGTCSVFFWRRIVPCRAQYGSAPWPLQEGVQALVLSVCSRRTVAVLHAWCQHCQDKAKQRQAEGQRLQAAVRRLARAKQATIFAAWHVHAQAQACQRQLCMRAIRPASITFLGFCMHCSLWVHVSLD